MQAEKKPTFTPAQTKSLKAIFSLYDTKRFGLISIEILGEMMRSLGLCPSEKEVGKLQATYQAEFDRNVMNLGDFAGLVEPRLRELSSPKDGILKAFRVFRQGKDEAEDGYWDISALELRSLMLTQEGLTISHEDLDEIFRDADIQEDGTINYEEFVRMLVS